MESATAPGKAQQQEPSKPSFFTRQSSGLVRGISLPSSVVLNLSFIGIVQAVLAVTLIPSTFPGASLVLATIIAVVLCLAPYAMYGLFARLMPRSGGDYVFASRSLGSWLGLAASINVTLWYIAAIAYLTYLIPQSALSGTFASIGAIDHSNTLLTWATDVIRDGWTFGIAAVVTVAIFIASSVRLTWTLRVAWVLLGLAVAGVIVSIIVMLFNSRSDFVSEVSSFGGNYAKVIADGRAAGFGSTGFSLGDTFLATTIAYFSLGFGIATAYTAGEIRSANRTALPGMLYALLIAGALMVVTFALAESRFGTDFLGAATTLSNGESSAYPFDAPANFFFFVSMLSGSTVIAVLLGAAYVAAATALCIPVFLICSRSLFAWSFDRLMPTGLSEVNSRTHSPIRANVVVVVVALGYLALMTFGPADFVTILVSQVLGLIATYIVVSIAGIVIAYRRPDLYEMMGSDRRIFGVPVLTLVSALAFLVYAFWFIVLLTTDSLGANVGVGMTAFFVVLGISVLAYPISYLINRSRGVDLSLANKTLPPE